MASKQEQDFIKVSNKSGGPCLMGQDHNFKVISASDPFSNELFIEIVCLGCGARNRAKRKGE
jgi:hypothetical protein